MAVHSTETNTKPQLNVIYLVRALAILGVVTVHVSSIPIGQIVDSQSTTLKVANFFNIFTKFGTTTFIFLSALVLFYSYYKRPMTGKLLVQFYKRRLLYIVVPYVLCSIFYYYIQIFHSYGETWQGFIENASFKQFGTMLLYGKAFYHLYFVYISLQLYLVFPILLWIVQRIPSLTKHLIWIGLLLYWGFNLYHHYGVRFDDKATLAITYLAFYFLGAYSGIYFERISAFLDFSRNSVSYLRKLVLWIPLWSIWLGISLYHVHAMYEVRTNGLIVNPIGYDTIWLLQGLSASFVLLQIAQSLMQWLPRSGINRLIDLGVVSFGIYIVHPAILFYYFRIGTITDPLLYKLNILSGFLVTLGLSWAITALAFKYLPQSWILFGSKPKTSPYIQPKKSSIPSTGVRQPMNM